MIYDAFPFHDELEMLECRLTELETVPDLVHVIVEARVTHQDAPKPLYYADNRERFSAWSERIIHVVADELPTMAQDPDPWARELAQRTYIPRGLVDAKRDDVLLQSDVDEIPRPLVVRNLKPTGLVALAQRGHFWAVDWLYPMPWFGTVACRVGDAPDMPRMRSLRNMVKSIPNAGWHLSWLGGPDRWRHKLGSFCHPEVAERVEHGITDETFYTHGWHVDGHRMKPVDVDKTWPRYVYERRCPPSWFRPR